MFPKWVVSSLLGCILVSGCVAPMTPTASSPDRALEKRLRATVSHLAGDIGARSVWEPEKLQESREWLIRQIQLLGLKPQEQVFTAHYRSRDGSPKTLQVANVFTEIPGQNTAEVLVLGAHYDSRIGMAKAAFGRYADASFPSTPGANDNASGVAAVLEAARALRSSNLACTLRLVFWVNEEYPFYGNFQSKDGWQGMGSFEDARFLASQTRRVKGAISVDMLGSFSDEAGSQKFLTPWGRVPSPLSRVVFPRHRADFVAIVGNRASAGFVKETRLLWQKAGKTPVMSLTPPFTSRGSASDEWSYWQQGMPALAITDTAYNRYDHYHRETDTPDQLNYSAFAHATSALIETVSGLAGKSNDDAALPTK